MGCPATGSRPGAKPLGKCGSKFTLAIAVPTGQEGFIWPSAPISAGGLWVASDDAETLPDERELWSLDCGRGGA